MVADQRFETYRKQIAILSHVVATSRGSLDLEDREARLRAACECAALSLKRDLEAIVELERAFSSASSPTRSARD